MTFLQFCFRRTGFGRTSWPQFAVIMGFSIVLLALGYWGCPPDESVLNLSPNGDGSWTGSRPFNSARFAAYAFGFGVPCVLVFGTWMNYKSRWV